MADEAKARSLLADANKKYNAKSWIPWSGQANKEAAIELYDKAASHFKIAKCWDDAGETYLLAAAASERLSDLANASSYYMNAGKAYKNSSPKEAVKAYLIAVELYKEKGRFSTAAKLYRDIAEMQEKEGQLVEAAKTYNKAADAFRAESADTSSNQMLLKVAELTAAQEEYAKAIEIYAKVCEAALESRAQSHSVKDYMFKSALCHFILNAKRDDPDLQDLEAAMNDFKDQHPNFDGSRECKLIEDCAKAFREDAEDNFTDVVFRYDQLSRLDDWTANILLTIKNILKNGNAPAADGEGDELDFLR